MTGSSEVDADRRIAQIYERYAPDVAAYLLRRSSRSDAADAVGETFLVAWRRHDAIPDEPDTLPWLYGVARRVLANQRRGNHRRTRLGDRLASMLDESDVGSPSRLYEASEELALVAATLEELSESDAEILRLAAWEAMTPTEIAAVLGVSPGSARQRLHRARKRLRRRMQATTRRRVAARRSERAELADKPSQPERRGVQS